jgi:energy-coupling factor transporter ATP-binding protein EcfA2
MTVDNLVINNSIRSFEKMNEMTADVKSTLEQRINLHEYPNDRPVVISQSVVMRMCLLAGLADKTPRTADEVANLNIQLTNTPYATTFFTKQNIGQLVEALLKMRYHDVDADWKSSSVVSRVIAHEILRGSRILLEEGGLDDWLRFSPLKGGASANDIPELNLCLGQYDENMLAHIDINSRAIQNTQILVAGTTGSGKSNLLAVLLHEMRSASSDTHYPVNFLLFDYKGEFSDPQNASWLTLFDVDQSSILNPMERPLPFTPFKDFTGKPINELNLYSTTLATALLAISSGAKISANMDNRLSDAIVNAYKENKMKPVTFQMIYDHYNLLLTEKKQAEMDSVKSVLNQLIKNNVFADEDKIDLVHSCNIINLGRFEKNGIIAKAIVYFVISKLNNIYETLPKQAVNDERVEIRHFTIIDEAHYMLDFENKPLQNLIAVGRNKGMSIILATQNMTDFKSKSIDFFQNAQYPLIMKQQQQNDAVLKDLFGVSGNQLQELKTAITGLQKGELITRDNAMAALGLGSSWKKIKVTHLI